MGRPVISDNSKRIATRTIGLIGVAWGAIVLAFLTWQLLTYRGIMASLIEWQFFRFDTSFPVLTVVLLLLLLVSPIMLILFIRIRKKRGQPESKTLAQGIHRAQVMRKFLFGIGAGILLVAAITALIGRTLGDARERPVTVTMTELENETDVEGTVRMRGTLQLDRIGFFEDRLLIFGRTLWVAPATSSPDDSDVRLFVEVDQTQVGTAETTELVGFLRKAGVPGEIRTLYEYAGFEVQQPTYLLFRSAKSARAPLYGAAVDFLIVAIIFLLFGLAQTLRIRGLKRQAE